MYQSALATWLWSPGLPATGYAFATHTLFERDVMLARLAALPGAVAGAGPCLRSIEVDDRDERAIYLVTEPGHFAHPSILRRGLIDVDGARAIEVRGWTAADADVMARWVEQFRTQDVHQRVALGI